MRPIDADALTDDILKSAVMIDDTGIQTGYEIAIELIKRQPTIDAEPVRHGKWIIRDNPDTGWYRVTCSECGEDVTANAPCIGFFPNAKVIWNYCPECGADMRGETNE